MNYNFSPVYLCVIPRLKFHNESYRAKEGEGLYYSARAVSPFIEIVTTHCEIGIRQLARALSLSRSHYNTIFSPFEAGGCLSEERE